MKSTILATSTLFLLTLGFSQSSFAQTTVDSTLLDFTQAINSDGPDGSTANDSFSDSTGTGPLTSSLAEKVEDDGSTADFDWQTDTTATGTLALVQSIPNLYALDLDLDGFNDNQLFYSSDSPGSSTAGSTINQDAELASQISSVNETNSLTFGHAFRNEVDAFNDVSDADGGSGIDSQNSYQNVGDQDLQVNISGFNQSLLLISDITNLEDYSTFMEGTNSQSTSINHDLARQAQTQAGFDVNIQDSNVNQLNIESTLDGEVSYDTSLQASDQSVSETYLGSTLYELQHDITTRNTMVDQLQITHAGFTAQEITHNVSSNGAFSIDGFDDLFQVVSYRLDFDKPWEITDLDFIVSIDSEGTFQSRFTFEGPGIDFEFTETDSFFTLDDLPNPDGLIDRRVYGPGVYTITFLQEVQFEAVDSGVNSSSDLSNTATITADFQLVGAVIPEPSSLAIFAMSGMLLARRRSR